MNHEQAVQWLQNRMKGKWTWYNVVARYGGIVDYFEKPEKPRFIGINHGVLRGNAPPTYTPVIDLYGLSTPFGAGTYVEVLTTGQAKFRSCRTLREAVEVVYDCHVDLQLDALEQLGNILNDP